MLSWGCWENKQKSRGSIFFKMTPGLGMLRMLLALPMWNIEVTPPMANNALILKTSGSVRTSKIPRNSWGSKNKNTSRGRHFVRLQTCKKRYKVMFSLRQFTSLMKEHFFCQILCVCVWCWGGNMKFFWGLVDWAQGSLMMIQLDSCISGSCSSNWIWTTDLTSLPNDWFLG